MLHEFVTTYRDAIIARTREKVGHRPWPPPSASELENGVPLFLTQLSDTLRHESNATPGSPDAIGISAARHGGELLALGFTISQVVYDYGDICQAVTELAVELNAPITIEEFHTLNRCLDNAIAEAVTEHARVTAQSTYTGEVERLGQLAHEIRDLLNTSIFAFHALKRGTVAINGSTGAVLGRSLMALRDLADSTLSNIRLAATQPQRERMAVTTFVDHIGTGGSLHAEYRGLAFSIAAVDPALMIDIDAQLLGSAVTNLLNNAFKFSRAGGHIILRANRQEDRLLIEVEDECGGIADTAKDPFQPFTERRGKDRTGLGLGLSIARKAVRAHGGDIGFRNLPGKGCVFVIDVPLALEHTAAPQAAPIGTTVNEGIEQNV